jgi:hypothetical protein
LWSFGLVVCIVEMSTAATSVHLLLTTEKTEHE